MTVLAIVTTLLFCGCKVVTPEGQSCFECYPLAISGTGSTSNLPVLRAAGFNLIVGGSSEQDLNAAARVGLGVITTVPVAWGKSIDTNQVQIKIRQSEGHPALQGWLLSDEPEMRGVSPDQVRELGRAVRALGARKPTYLVLYQGYEALDYAHCADVLCVDRYPIPWLPLANFGQHMKMARLALGRNKPLIAVVQAFDWAYYPTVMSEDPGRMRPPTREEIRCMVYCALVEGATGLMFYSYDDGPGRWRMAEHPETWRAVCDVVTEVRRRLPLFEGTHYWWDRNHRYGDPSRRFNAALLSSVSAARVRVTRGTAAVPAGEYIVAVNTTELDQEYSFALPAGRNSVVPVFEEGRVLAVDRGRVTDHFEQYGLHVYGPLGGL